MSERIAVAPALAELELRLRSASEEADLAQVLRALQRLGLSQSDLSIHIERLRAYNDATEQRDHVDENCLRALDLVTGYSEEGLRWDAAQIAPIILSSVLDRGALEDAFNDAVHPNDLLPPRPYDQVSTETASRVVDWVYHSLHGQHYRVQTADIFRTPKSPFTTRPAALLALPDRLALEALATKIKPRLGQLLPPGILWPRGFESDSPSEAIAKYRTQPLEWESPYVVKADIADFYGTVDHAILGLITSTHLAMPRKYGQATESLLSALMAIDRGLPQGVPASDVFASVFLLPVDARLSNSGTTYIRFSDDYLFPASSLDEARRLLESLEEDLRSVGLSLNDDKTTIMRSDTYRKGLTEHAAALSSLVTALRASYAPEIDCDDTEWDSVSTLYAEDTESNEFEDIVGPLWEHLYHADVTIIDVIEDLKSSIQDELVQTHEMLLSALVRELESGRNVDKKAEDLGRQCLVFLAAAQSKVELDDVEQLLQWFPKLAPTISLYLNSIADDTPSEIGRFLVRALERQPKSDWTTGWLCSVATRPGIRLQKRLVALLQDLAKNKDEGLLTRTSAVRALAVARKLDEATWFDLYVDATSAIQSEMIFSALFEKSLYPWSVRSLEPESGWLALEEFHELEDPPSSMN